MGYSGVTWSESDQTVLPRSVPGTRIAVCMRTLKGPLAEATLIRSWTEYERIFGGLSASFDDAHWAQFALDSGCELIVSRVVHATDPNDIATITATKALIAVPDRDTASPPSQLSSVGPFMMDNADDLVIDLNGAPLAPISVTGTDADVESGVVGGDFTGGKILNVKIDQGTTQYIPFVNGDFANPAVPTAAEIDIVLNRELVGAHSAVTNVTHVTIYSDCKGDDSYVQVTGGTANVLLAFSTAEVHGTGNVGNLNAVTSTEIVTLLSAIAGYGVTWNASVVAGKVYIVTVAEGSAVHLGFDAPSLMAPKMGWTVGAGGDVVGTDASGNTSITIYEKYYGGTGAGIAVTIQNNPADATRFDIIVPTQTGTGFNITTQEKFESLTVDNADSRYCVNIVNNASLWIGLVDNASPTVAPNDEPLAGSYTLVGGVTGLAGLVPADYLGGVTSKLGVHAFDGVTLIKDGCMDLMTPYLQTLVAPRDTMYLIDTYTRTRRDMVYYMSNPDGDSTADAIAFRNATGAYVGGTKFNSTYSALYTCEGRTVDSLSSGSIWLNALAGLAPVLSYTDNKGTDKAGPWQAPCGARRGKVNFLEIDPNMGSPALVTTSHDLEDANINRLADFDSGPQIEDQQTLQYGVDSAFNMLGCRRGAIWMEQRVLAAFRLGKDEIIDTALFRATYNACAPIMKEFKRKGGCYDWRIVCDQDAANIDACVLHTPDDIDHGRLKMKVYWKPSRHARELGCEFIATATSVDYTEMAV